MNVETRTASSLEKIFCSSVCDAPKLSGISALKGERVSFQVAVKSSDPAVLTAAADKGNFGGEVILREVVNIPSLLPAAPEDDYVLRKEPGLFPDALVPVTGEIALSPGNWHALWVTLVVPESLPAGVYTVGVKLKIVSRYAHTAWCTEGTFETAEHFELKVVDAVLPEQKLKVTHWFHADCIQHHYKVPAWSEEHWALLEKYFRNFAAHGSNLLLTPLWSLPLDIIPGITRRPDCQLLKIAYDGKKWSFDFSCLERWIGTAQRCGVKNFEMVHAFSQWGLKFPPEILVTRNGKEERMFGTAMPSTAPEYAEFLRALTAELLPFLRAHGLTPENCYFHISDEPPESALENYTYASKLYRSLLGDYPVIDALSSVKFFKNGLIDRPIPHEANLDEFLAEKVAERWVYYAGEWHDGMPGRQFGMPSLRNRILGILLYVYGCDGFLEWGYNFWFSMFNFTQEIDPWQDSNSGRSFRSGGAYLVYPGPDGPVDSLRHEVIAEGFEDERALRLLETKSSREEVLALLDEVTGYRIGLRKYPRDEQWLLRLREKVNEKLAGLCR